MRGANLLTVFSDVDALASSLVTSKVEATPSIELKVVKEP